MPETGVTISPAVAEQMRQAGPWGSLVAPGPVSTLAQQAVAAWAAAVDGDGAALAALGGPDAERWLTGPVNSRDRRLAPGARTTSIEVHRMDLAAGPAQLDIRFEFTGHWQAAGPVPPVSRVTGLGVETQFIGFLELRMEGTGSQPWRLRAGHIDRLSSWLGYEFTSRRETPQEYQQRTGRAGIPGPGPRPGAAGRVFRLAAGFAEHDERLGSSATADVQRADAPGREEAEALIWPAIWAATEQALGPGDWRPSLTWLEVIELIG